MRIFLFAGFALILAGLFGISPAFEIQYPGEDGFFIGKPMTYVVTRDDGNEENIGQEGVFIFGRDLITIDGVEYYDAVFDSPSSSSHFYLGLDPIKDDLIQKGLKVGSSDLNLTPAIIGVDYPLSPGDNWSDKTDVTATNLEVPGLGVFPIPISVKNVEAVTKVSSEILPVPAGTFDTLLVESTFTGSLLGIPMTLVQRTWLSEDNVPVKRNFDLAGTVLYEIELSELTPTPWDVNWDGLVDIRDLVLVAKSFDRKIESVRIPNPDVDGNGIVDILDLVKVGGHFGETY